MFKARIWKYLFRVVGYLVLAGGGSKQNLSFTYRYKHLESIFSSISYVEYAIKYKSKTVSRIPSKNTWYVLLNSETKI